MASDVLKWHAAQKSHQNSCVKQSSFLSKYAGAEPNVIQQLQNCNALQAKENAEKWKSILACVEFCGCQGNLPRGHREGVLEREIASNQGNFLSLVRFRLKSRDNRLLQDFHKAGNLQGKHEPTCLSPFIQNELIECLGEEVQSCF